MKKWKQLAEKSREEVEKELRIDISERRHSLIQYGEHTDEDLSDSSEKQDDTLEGESLATDGDTENRSVASNSPSRNDADDERDSSVETVHEKYDEENVTPADWREQCRKHDSGWEEWYFILQNIYRTRRCASDAQIILDLYTLMCNPDKNYP